MELPKAFIAMTASEAQGVQEHQCLSARAFEYAPSKRFFCLLRSAEEAFSVALRMYTGNAVKSAVEATTWFVMQIEFTEQQWLSMLLDQNNEVQINRGPGPLYNEWHVSGVLKLAEMRFEWMRLELEPIGVQAWAQKFLSKRKRPSVTDANCAGCRAEKV